MSKVVLLNAGMLSVTAMYLHSVNNSRNYYYIRRVPDDVKEALDQANSPFEPTGNTIVDVCHKPMARIMISTRTADKKKALLEARRINNIVEAEWSSILNPSGRITADAQRLIARYSDRNYDLSDYLDDRLSDIAKHELQQIEHTRLPPTIMREETDAILRKHLTAVEWQALQLSRGSSSWTLSSIRDEYIELKGLLGESGRKDRNTVTGAFKTLIELLGDVDPSTLTRLAIHNAIVAMTANDLKSETIKRKLSSVRAAINYVGKMHEVEFGSAFSGAVIPNLYEDKTERGQFTKEQLGDLRDRVTANISNNNLDPIDGIMAVMMDTGMRVSEALGLKAEDVVLDKEVPFANLRFNEMRRLKTKNSERLIPLVGAALEWLAAWKATGSKAEFIFEKYLNEDTGRFKNDNVSATANKRLRTQFNNKLLTCHSFRHTMNTRLRNTLCPKDIRDELCGWTKSTSDRYGSPHDLKIKQSYLLATLNTTLEGNSNL